MSQISSIRTTVIFGYSDFQIEAPDPSAFFYTSDLYAHTEKSLLDHLSIFYSYCQILQEQIEESLNKKYSAILVDVITMKRMLPPGYNQKAAKYNDELKRAKKQYLIKTGKKIAVGFKYTDEYKRILRNKNRALRRLQKKQSEIVDEYVRSKSGGKKISDAQRMALEIEAGVSDVFYLAFRQIFYDVLSYGDKAIKDIQKELQDQTGSISFIKLSENQGFQ